MATETVTKKTFLTWLGDLLALATKNEVLIIGALASVVVLLVGELHIVVSKTTVVEILTPFVTSVLIALDKKVGVGTAVAKLLPPYSATS